MKKINELILEIEKDENCIVSRLPVPYKKLPYEVPNDLKFYLENYNSIVFFQNTHYSIKIVGLTEFKRANKIIIGEDYDDDISHNWFIIAHDNNSQYITIDLSKDRLGYCYDSFWDRYGVVGEQSIIAKSFTELLERIYASKGNMWYWMREDFSSYGDAYDR